jgi:ABC-type uncharacterized transport system permease subunit
MSLNQTIISLLTFLVYSLCALAQFFHIKGRRPFPKLKLISSGLLAATLHGYLLYGWIDTPYGQNLSISHMFSLVAWLIAVLTLISSIYSPNEQNQMQVNHLHQNNPMLTAKNVKIGMGKGISLKGISFLKLGDLQNLAIFTLPMAAISIPLAWLFPGNDYFQTGLYPLRLLHILISIAALGVMGMAALQATLLHIQTQRIRNKTAEAKLWFLPPLQTMETLLFQIIWIGFLFLSASLASACIFLEDIFQINLFQKMFFSFLAWGFFAVLLYGHHRSGWRGTRVVRFTLSGMVLLIVAYFSSKLILLKYWT